MKYPIFLMLVFLLVIIGYQYYRSQQVQENFAQDYLNNIMSYVNNIKISNKDKLDRIKSAKIKKEQKYKTLSEMKKEKILITGATSGLGYHIAKYVNTFKPKLFISGKNKEKVEKIVQELKKTNPNVYGHHADFTKKKSISRLYDAVLKSMRNVSILINATNIKKGSSLLLNKNEKDYRSEIDVNITATIILSQKFGHRMSMYKTQGRIINFTSYRSKNNKFNSTNPDKILTENMIETFSSVFAQEMYSYGIGVTTIRMDELYDFNKNGNKFFNVNRVMGKTLGEVFSNPPTKLNPVIEYTLRAPFHDIAGKVISTDNFKNNKELLNIVPPSKLSNDSKVFNNVTITKTIPRDKVGKVSLLTKQNPYPYSPKIKTFLKSDGNFNRFNTMGKYDSILDNVLAKKYGVKKQQIVFFKTEYDAIKKILELFVSKGNEILTTNTPFSFLQLASVENKSTIEVVTLANTYDRFLDINYSNFKYTPKTKMVYLSSPNNISGLCIRENSRWDLFLKNIPENVVLVIDERYIDFVQKPKKNTKHKQKTQRNNASYLNTLKLLKKRKNTIILRSFNNYYSIENLELCYIITSKEIASLIKNTQLINPIDRFVENMALTVIDDKYYKEIKNKIADERHIMFKKLEKNNIKYYDSDANFFLIETNSSKDSIMNDLENTDIIMYNSHEGLNNYWTLPISTPEINKQVLEVILYDNMENI